MIHLNNGDWWEWQERQLQDWLLDQKIAGHMPRDNWNDDTGDDFDDINAELSEIEMEW